LFQQDEVALKAVLRANWVLRRAGAAAMMEDISW
jgi:hypothetical protein